MFSTLNEFSTQVLTRLGTIEDSDIKPTSDQVQDAARSSLVELSDYRPRMITFQRVGDNTRRFVLSAILTGPPAWVEGAEINAVHVVTDADTDNEFVTELAAEDWSVRIDTNGASVLYLSLAISASQTMRVLWRLPHEMNGLDSATVSTFKLRDQDPLLWLAAAHLAETISRSASDKKNMTLGVDQMSHDTVPFRWMRRANELRARAVERLAPTEVDAGAGASVDWDTRSQLGRGSTDRVSH